MYQLALVFGMQKRSSLMHPNVYRFSTSSVWCRKNHTQKKEHQQWNQEFTMLLNCMRISVELRIVLIFFALFCRETIILHLFPEMVLHSKYSFTSYSACLHSSTRRPKCVCKHGNSKQFDLSFVMYFCRRLSKNNTTFGSFSMVIKCIITINVHHTNAAKKRKKNLHDLINKFMKYRWRGKQKKKNIWRTKSY